MVAARGLQALLALLEVLRPTLTAPSYGKLPALVMGWLCTTGRHAVTESLLVMGLSRRVDHESFHRFFSRGTWEPDEWGRALLGLILRLVPEGEPLRLVIDDTLAPHKGPEVFGLGTHLDPVHSTRKHKVFRFGHVWVVLAVLVRVPFSTRIWALPLLLRLYRTERATTKLGELHRRKPELARELVDIVLTWTARDIHLSADSAYCNSSVAGGLSPRVLLLGSMRTDAALTAAPIKPRKRGPGREAFRGLPMRSPEVLAADTRTPWKTCKATLYGKLRTVAFKTCEAQWYRVSGRRMLRVVVVRELEGKKLLRAFFSTNPAHSVVEILEGYSWRWAIEVTFRELKQSLGFTQSSARKRASVERTAPFVAYLYTLLALWASLKPAAQRLATPPFRPWYSGKTDLSFDDLLRASRTAGRSARIADLLPHRENLRKPATRASAARQQPFRFAG
jgi:hypothetical protein